MTSSRCLSRAVTIALGFLAVGTAPAAISAGPDHLRAVLRDSSGKDHGHVDIHAAKDGLGGSAEVTGLSPGEHGFHIHRIGKCDAPDFMSAGDHLNPDARQHGIDNPKGPHQGDLPSLTAGADGKAKASFTVQSSLAQLMDADGAAVVVHAKPDDNRTDPSGNAGARLLCGILMHGAR